MANNIPAISKAKFGDAGQQRNVDTMANAVDTLAGRKGNGLDRAVLMRDLHDLGIAKVTAKAGGGTKAIYIPPNAGTSGEVVEFPEAPSTEYNAGIDAVFISWDEPLFQGFLYAEIFRGTTSDVSKAVLLDRTTGILYVDNVGWSDSNMPAGGYYYWVRFVNTNDEEGPFDTPKTNNNRHIAPTQNPKDIIDKATNAIGQSNLTKALSDSLAATKAQAQKGVTDALNAQHQADKGVRDAATAQTKANSAFNGVTRIDTSIGGLYTATVAGNGTDGNPIFGGFGLGADPDTKTVDAAFHVDKFYIGRPGLGNALPFIVDGKDVMINSAIINEASINHAVTNTMIANKLKAQTVDSVKLNSAELTGGTIYVPNSTHPKFSVDSRGIMHAVDGIFSGQLQAATGTFSGALQAATGTFSGALQAATGTFKGTVYADQFVGDVVSAKLYPVPSFPSGRENVHVHIATITVTNRNSTTATLLIPSVPLFAYALTQRPGGNGSSHATGKIEWFIRENDKSGKIISHDICSATHSITVSGGTADNHSGSQTTSLLSHQAVVPIAAGATKTISIDAVVSGTHSESTSGYGGHFAVKTQNIVAVFYRDGGAFS
ncbi:TPA: phage tail tip fiber protein [Vibrio harveyi]